MNKQIHNVDYLKARRKELRNHLTPAEAALWNALKGAAVRGRKFRRQHSVGNYILDFYCPAEKLAIELDGDIHNDPMVAVYDAERTLHLERLGIQVVRFGNKLEFNDLRGVLRVIEGYFDNSQH